MSVYNVHTIAHLFYFVKHWETEWENSGTEAHTIIMPVMWDNRMAKYERKRGKESCMYIYYVLRGKQGGKQVELEGDIDEEHFPGVDLGDGREILIFLAQAVEREAGTAGEWEEAELTDSFFDKEDMYILFNGRWMRRSDAPWRKDRDN